MAYPRVSETHRAQYDALKRHFTTANSEREQVLAVKRFRGAAGEAVYQGLVHELSIEAGYDIPAEGQEQLGLFRNKFAPQPV